MLFRSVIDLFQCIRCVLMNAENNIRYADDTAIFADNLASLQLLMDSVTSYSR